MSEESAKLRERLDDLGRRLAAWNGTVDGHFQKLWSFNSARKGAPLQRGEAGRRSGAFERSLLEAAKTAEKRAGSGPRGEGYTLLAEVCDFYAGADAVERAELARVVKSSNALAVLCLWFAGRACRVIETTGGPEWLRRATTAAALADTEPDYRDWYLTLGEVWVVAVRRGVDPRGAFAAASAIAPERRDTGGGSTRKMLGEFEKSAYFAESVAPKLLNPNPMDQE